MLGGGRLLVVLGYVFGGWLVVVGGQWWLVGGGWLSG